MIYLHDIDPLAFSLGPIKVHWYGIMYLLGFAAAWWLGRSRVRAGRLPGVDMNGFSDLLFYAMLGVVLGGRIGYMLFYATSEFLHNPLLLLRVWEGGMSFHGGLLGVMAAGWWWTRKHALHYFDTIDFVAPLVPLGLASGRLGNFINGELWGRVTDPNAFWAMGFQHARAEDMAIVGQDPSRWLAIWEQWQMLPRHPSQLYQFALEGVALFVIVWLFSQKPRPQGQVAALFLLGYGVFRFIAEFARQPDDYLGLLALSMSMGQWLSLPMIALGLAGFVYFGRRNKQAA